MSTIGNRIKQIRKDKKLTQVELGQLIGISGAGVGKIETNVSKPTEAAIKLICATYHVHNLWLTTGEGPMYEKVSGEALVDKYAPDADERFKAVMRQMDKLPDEAWDAFKGFMMYLVDSVDSMRSDHDSEKNEGQP